jgi:hypothetical protein
MKGSGALLNEAIDRIAGGEATPERENVVAASLSPEEIREAAVIHLSTLLEAEPDGIDGEEIRLGGLAVKLRATDDPKAPIRYEDVSVGFAIEGASLRRSDGPRSLEALLRIYQYARDRSDVLLYLPQAMRAERISSLAHSTGASDRFVRYVLARYRTLSDKAAA